MKRVLIVGATGDVGQGIVAEALAAGWQVIAAARDAGRLAALGDPGRSFATVTGSLASAADAEALWDRAAAAFGGLDAVVVSVNATPAAPRPLLDWDRDALLGILDANTLTHFNAAKAFVPRLPADGVFLGIGGGTADFVLPGMGQLSMAQAAQRMMYRAIARERRDAGPAVRELMIVSMVNGASKRAQAQPAWLTEREIGRHVCAILDAPADFAGPILTLSDRADIGRGTRA